MAVVVEASAFAGAFFIFHLLKLCYNILNTKNLITACLL
nr:MAG TPA: hypothetical protein [Caudoviricetes sp.]